ncbi:MAG: superoxide dismutase [Verrucomicrobia bacterium]|nr:MAG: superoxide dismutase [Verrucomicrobiota bacterium]
MMKPPTAALSRRDVLKAFGAGLASFGLAALARGQDAARVPAREVKPGTRQMPVPSGPFQVPALGYSFDALEPAIDARTMEIHYTKHHAAYVAKANIAVQDYPQLHGMAPEDILRDMRAVPGAIYMQIRNHLGGHVNHTIFWDVLTPGGAKSPVGALGRQIEKDFGGYDQFVRQFSDAARSRFGSGWAWLVEYNRKLSVISTANQDSPYMEGYTPILGLDVWEHAYYLKYQNRRGDYISAVMPLFNWDRANARFEAAIKKR